MCTCNSATKKKVGNVILCKEEGDASRISIILVKITETKPTVAIGTICNDHSSDRINAGHHVHNDTHKIDCSDVEKTGKLAIN